MKPPEAGKKGMGLEGGKKAYYNEANKEGGGKKN